MPFELLNYLSFWSLNYFLVQDHLILHGQPQIYLQLNAHHKVTFLLLQDKHKLIHFDQLIDFLNHQYVFIHHLIHHESYQKD
jgi:hypothetical protein